MGANLCSRSIDFVPWSIEVPGPKIVTAEWAGPGLVEAFENQHEMHKGRSTGGSARDWCFVDFRRSISMYSLGFAACVIWWLSVFLGAMQRDWMGTTSPHEKCMISRRLKEMDNHRFECMVSCLQNCYSCCRFLIIPDIQGSKTNLSLLTSKKSIRKARVTHLL